MSEKGDFFLFILVQIYQSIFTPQYTIFIVFYKRFNLANYRLCKPLIYSSLSLYSEDDSFLLP